MSTFHYINRKVNAKVSIALLRLAFSAVALAHPSVFLPPPTGTPTPTDRRPAPHTHPPDTCRKLYHVAQSCTLTTPTQSANRRT